jgi:predicted nucleic acid-binding protein
VRRAVVDASVAAKWVIEEEHSEKAVLLLGYDTLLAPGHWRAEAANALWAKVTYAELAPAEAEERLRELMRAPIVETPIDRLMPRAFNIGIALSTTIYDSLYVALAEESGAPMVTADERLIRKVSVDARFSKLMVWVSTVSA